jgi:hypothetical protein
MNDTKAGGLTGHLWRSDHPRTGAGNLTDPWWCSNHQGQFWLLENHFVPEKITPRISTTQV